MNWDDWTERLDRMDLRENYFTAANLNHPSNTVWQAEDGARLAAFLPGLDDKPVGVDFAARNRQLTRSTVSNSIPVGLSRFSVAPVTVEYAIESPRSASRLERSASSQAKPSSGCH